MPKTFTDDIAPALPSSLEGPLQVVDPSDDAGFLKIDPENARIEAAGNARPVRQITFDYSRASGIANVAVIGTVLDARSISSILDAGFYSTPFHLPPDMDLGEPCSVKYLLAAAANIAGTQVVRLELLGTHGKDGDASLTESAITYDWTTPSTWKTEHPKQVTIDNGNGHTFDADTFETTDLLGLRVRRMATAAEDTYTQTLYIANGALFSYTAKQI